MTYAIAVVGLLLLVLIHELGHFAACKAVGMRALRFSIGFPPALVRRRFGDTEYAIGAIPLGGYVKIPGMLRPDASDLIDVDDLLERAEALSEQDAIRVAAALDATGRALSRGRVDTAREGLDELEAALAVAGESVPPARARRIGRALERVRDGLDPRSYWRSSRPRRLIVIVAGPAANVVACFLLLAALAVTGQPGPLAPSVSKIVAGSPAQHSGLRPNDVILSVNGTHGGPARFRSAIMRSRGGPVTVVVLRDHRRVVLRTVHSRLQQGAYRLGFEFGQQLVTHSLLAAPGVALAEMEHLTGGTLSALSNVTTSRGRAQLHSTVGIVQYSAVAASDGTPYYLTLLAYISLSLAIFNLLPFLPLDGGHVLLIGIERLRGGRAVSRTAFERISAVGIVLMLLVFVIGLQNDINSLVGPTH
ncbi:MAG TPA: site-2 protease family protein [Gaiellales bacterium]|nr:site-2 protease family protein [Gaiellales bacterium]